MGLFVIPLWLPVAFCGLPTAILWRREIFRRRWSGKHYYKVVRERFGPATSRLISTTVFVIAFLVTLYVTEWIVRTLDRALSPRDLGEVLRESLHLSETTSLVLLLFICFFIPYPVAKLVHRWARWKICYDDAPRCVRCSYDLTGNVSGRCPECGTPTERVAAPP